MEDNLQWKMIIEGPLMEDNEDNLKSKEVLHIAGRHTALDIFSVAVFFLFDIENCHFLDPQNISFVDPSHPLTLNPKFLEYLVC